MTDWAIVWAKRESVRSSKVVVSRNWKNGFVLFVKRIAIHRFVWILFAMICQAWIISTKFEVIKIFLRNILASHSDGHRCVRASRGDVREHKIGCTLIWDKFSSPFESYRRLCFLSDTRSVTGLLQSWNCRNGQASSTLLGLHYENSLGLFFLRNK